MSMNDRLVDIVQEGIDAAVRVGALNDSSLVARRVGQLAGVTCASPEFIGQHGMPRAPQELDPAHCIPLFKLGSGQVRDWLFRKGDLGHTITPAASLMFSDPE